MATIKDVAKLAGVSVATVSRFINKNGYVNEETKLRVEQAIDKLQYERNAMARGLATKKTETIALILPDISNPFFPELARAVEDVARTYGYTVILCNSDNQVNKEKGYIHVLKQRYIDGILFASHTLGAEEVGLMKKNNIPFVVLDRVPAEVECSVVRSKNFEGAQIAFQHLQEVGCRKIAHIYGPQELATAKERLMGYEQLAREFDWFSPSLMVQGDFTIDGGGIAVELLMSRHPDIDGIFIGNDLMALGAMKKLKQMGIHVPDQVAICGFDGIHLTKIADPELTTIAQPTYEIGMMATRLLIKKIEGLMEEDQTHEFDVTLLSRGSTERKIQV
ncbi:LacI family transcriptional regulator [Paenibacillus castaneae]|uniref:LacI family DNA-binding transcriptional regulator n=1 Tax=Paenibacillus castaneae TaxID=474957 RepID=UPI000C9AAA69|nr:LacI family DNA-binding transcriptional regulator [Paenibacillus castaneae]NIK76515.1 LacI family transcriptional regulator [Paenibacillus castaneae]